ncbi:hypothetical protein IFT59_07570 [Rhizobium sp. CFBP 8752]|uniref:hypothetical protein n=1 Tax=Rhizobium sp. CFBP 8752 TaxID=2775301 RepID=UPI001782CBFC|nr:hypothetical protein [Rhizobium sp. CFBP 8752]MBD8663110.1 hypothetical protein [Rhizobium sp. CFBP 8752]
MDAIEAIRDCLRKLDAKPGEPVNIFSIGEPLIDAWFDQDSIVNGLYSLEAQQVIEIMNGNRISLLKAITTSTTK